MEGPVTQPATEETWLPEADIVVRHGVEVETMPACAGLQTPCVRARKRGGDPTGVALLLLPVVVLRVRSGCPGDSFFFAGSCP